MPFAIAMMSGLMPAHSWANSLPVRPTPVLHFIDDQKQAVLSGQLLTARRNSLPGTRTPPSPWTGSIMIAAVSGPIAALVASRSPSSIMVEARGLWPEPFKILLVTGGCDGCEACGRGRRL